MYMYMYTTIHVINGIVCIKPNIMQLFVIILIDVPVIALVYPDCNVYIYLHVYVYVIHTMYIYMCM